MWVEKTKSGNYKFVERYKDYLTGKEKKASVTLEKNNASARKQAAEMLAGIIAASSSVRPCSTRFQS